MGKHHNWTKENYLFIAENTEGVSRKQMVQLFNYHFNANISVSQLDGFMARNNLKNNRDGRFTKGQKSWNKGMKGLQLGGEAGWFKKGQEPTNYREIGSERLDKDGYTMVKVADPSTWELKHRVIWEEVNGKVPDGYALIFGDGDKTNITLENLILVTRSQLVRMNQNNLIQDNVELTKIGVRIAEVYAQIGKRSNAEG